MDLSKMVDVSAYPSGADILGAYAAMAVIVVVGLIIATVVFDHFND